MPIYEFVCDQCHSEFEELVRSDQQSIDCPNCASKRVTKKLSVFAAQQSREAQPCCMLPTAPACQGCGDPSNPASSCPYRG